MYSLRLATRESISVITEHIVYTAALTVCSCYNVELLLVGILLSLAAV